MSAPMEEPELKKIKSTKADGPSQPLNLQVIAIDVGDDSTRCYYRIDVPQPQDIEEQKGAPLTVTVTIVCEPLGGDTSAANDDPVIVTCGCSRVACLIGSLTVMQYRLEAASSPRWHSVYSTENVSWLSMQPSFEPSSGIGSNEESSVGELAQLAAAVRRAIASDDRFPTGCGLCAFASRPLKPENYADAFVKHKIFRYVLSVPKNKPKFLVPLVVSPTHAIFLGSARKINSLPVAGAEKFRVQMSDTELWLRLRGHLDGKIAQQHRRRPVILVCGPKNIGKSTLARCLVNRLLATVTPQCDGVAYLDCDPGQTEFTPPGFVSLTLVRSPLFGPPFTHQAFALATTTSVDGAADDNDDAAVAPRILSAVCLGGSSPGSPSEYLATVGALAAEAAASLPTAVPLVVNTMGWTNGLGLVYLCETIRLVSPTSLVQIESDEPSRNLPVMMSPEFVSGYASPRLRHGLCAPDVAQCEYSLLCIPGRLRSQPCRYGAPQQRELAVLANLLPLDSCPVYRVPYGDVWVFVSAGDDQSSFDWRQLELVLNASLVGLCTLDDADIGDEAANESGGVLRSVRSLPAGARCLGVGLVRCADSPRRQLCVQTRLPADLLRSVRLLVHGVPDLPLAFLDRLYGSSETPTPSLPPPYVGELPDCGIGSLPLRTERRPLKHRRFERR